MITDRLLCWMSGWLYRRHERVPHDRLTKRVGGTLWFQAAIMCQRLRPKRRVT